MLRESDDLRQTSDEVPFLVSDLVGKDLEGYHVTVELGADAFSRIFLGEALSPTASSSPVVIKLLTMIHVEGQVEQERILHQIALLQAFQHPHIAPLVFAGVYEGMPYVGIECVGAVSLHDQLRIHKAGESVPQEEAWRVLAQIGHTLHAAHKQHLLHGYLTAHNVLFNTQEEVVITDFHLHALVKPKQAGMTGPLEEAIYRAPEQLAGQTNEQSDQYALGCLAYELLTGCKAFMIPSVSVPGMYYRTKSLIEPRQLNPALSSEIEGALLKAMAKEPAHRYSDILAFLAALGIAPAEEEEEVVVEQETLVLAEMKGSDLIVTGPTIEAIEIVKVEHTGPSDWVSLPTVPVSPIEEASADTRKAVVPPVQSVHGPSYRASMRVSGKWSGRYRWIFALVIGLVVLALVVETFIQVFTFSVPSKWIEETPSPTPITQNPTPSETSVSIPTIPVLATPPTGGFYPPQGTAPDPTPTLRPKPTQPPPSRPTPVPTPGLVEVSLNSFFNNEGIGRWPGEANFDGSGYSYPANQLPGGGQITVNDMPYQFPSNAQGVNDNIGAFGQTISLKTGNYHRILLLAASSWGPVSGMFTIRYTNSSTTTSYLTVPDWIAGSSNGLRTSYRYGPNSIAGNPAYIYVIPITLDATRTVNTLVLPWFQSGPSQSGRIHVFAVTLQP